MRAVSGMVRRPKARWPRLCFTLMGCSHYCADLCLVGVSVVSFGNGIVDERDKAGEHIEFEGNVAKRVAGYDVHQLTRN